MDAIGWIEQHSAAAQVIVGAVSALVWIVYLQLLLSNFARQRRSQIVINRGVGSGFDARCFIANLGFEPIYVLELILEIEGGGERHSSIITDRRAMTDRELNDPRAAANQGPIKSGEGFDAGSFDDLAAKVRAARNLPDDHPVEAVELTVVAVSAASAAPVAACRKYRVEQTRYGSRLNAETVGARQVRSLRARRRLKRRLKEHLRQGLG